MTKPNFIFKQVWLKTTEEQIEFLKTQKRDYSISYSTTIRNALDRYIKSWFKKQKAIK